MAVSRSIAAKLALAICAAVLALFGGIFAYDYHSAGAMIYRHAEENARDTHAAAAGAIRNKLTAAEATADTLARAAESVAFEHAAIAAMLRTTVAASDEIYGATIALAPDKKGQGFAPYFHRVGAELRYVDLAVEKYDYEHKAWYAAPAASGRAGWSEPYFDEGGGDILMTTYSAPIFRETAGGREFAGVATSDISLEWLEKLFKDSKVFGSGYGFLLSREGRLLSHPTKNLVMHTTILELAAQRRDPQLADIGRRMMAGESGLIEHFGGILHPHNFICFAPLGDEGWSLGIVYDAAALLADLNRYSSVMAGLALFGVVCLLAAVALIARRFTRPLRDLAVAAGGIAAGDLDVALPPAGGRDEVGRLNDAFSDMRDSLKRFIDRLAGRNEELQDLLQELRDSQFEIEGMVILDAHLALTGLAVIYGAIALYEEGIERDPARTMRDVKNAVAPIQRIVETLKTYMPLAAGQMADAATRETLNGAEFLRAAFADAAPPTDAPAVRVAAIGPATVSLPCEALTNIVRHVMNLAILSGAAELRAELTSPTDAPGVRLNFRWEGERGVDHLAYAAKPFRLLEIFGTEDFGEDQRVNLEQLVSLDIVRRFAALSSGDFASDIAPRVDGRFAYELRLQYAA